MICKKCNKELDSHFFCFRKDTKKHREICKLCSKGYKSNNADEFIKAKALIDDGKSKCTNCNETKELGEFYKDKNNRFGICTRCKTCKLKAHNSKKVYNYNKRKSTRYNITIEEVITLKTITNCQICNIGLETEAERNIDHNHKDGQVRGVLCSKCNRGLGAFNDNVDILHSAIEYLSRNGTPIYLPNKLIKL